MYATMVYLWQQCEEEGVGSVFIVDAHCDTLIDVLAGKRRLADESKGGHIDIPRLKRGGVGAQVFAAWIERSYLPGSAARRACQYIDAFYSEIEANPHDLVFVKTAADLARAEAEGKIGAILAIEGGEALDGAVEMIRIFYRLGVRLMTITWSDRNELGDGAYDPTGGGLTKAGVKVVQEMNRMGMVVDVSHAADATFWSILEHTHGPLVASHSNSRALFNHPRNLTDKQVEAIAARGGVVCATLVAPFLGPAYNSVSGLVDHIDHLVKVAGIEHVGTGSDFDGVGPDGLVAGMADTSDMGMIVAEMRRRGRPEHEIEAIMGRNLARVFAQILG
jgi:membrane dipeptidase